MIGSDFKTVMGRDDHITQVKKNSLLLINFKIHTHKKEIYDIIEDYAIYDSKTLENEVIDATNDSKDNIKNYLKKKSNIKVKFESYLQIMNEISMSLGMSFCTDI